MNDCHSLNIIKNKKLTIVFGFDFQHYKLCFLVGRLGEGLAGNCLLDDF
jgi:hypothetical protein